MNGSDVEVRLGRIQREADALNALMLERSVSRSSALRAAGLVLFGDVIALTMLGVLFLFFEGPMVVALGFVVFFFCCVVSVITWTGAVILVVTYSAVQAKDVAHQYALGTQRRKLLDAAEVRGALEVHQGGEREGALTLGTPGGLEVS